MLSQDYTDFEYVVMDAGSTDGTVEILKLYSDPRMRWVSEPDNGQADALNKGLRMTTGSLLTWINSDDVLLPGALNTLVDYFDQHPEADMVYGDVNIISSAGEFITVSQSDQLTPQTAVTGELTVMQQGGMWRRTVTDAIGGFADDLHFVFDAEYWVRMIVKGYRVVHLPGVRAAFRMHDTSKTVSQRRRFVEEWTKVFDRLYADPSLPADLRSLRADADAFLDWQFAKADWRVKAYQSARPYLMRTLRSKRLTRRGLSALMLIDSYLGTPFTMSAVALIQRLTGRGIETLNPMLYGKR